MASLPPPIGLLVSFACVGQSRPAWNQLKLRRMTDSEQGGVSVFGTDDADNMVGAETECASNCACYCGVATKTFVRSPKPISCRELKSIQSIFFGLNSVTQPLYDFQGQSTVASTMDLLFIMASMALAVYLYKLMKGAWDAGRRLLSGGGTSRVRSVRSSYSAVGFAELLS